MNTNMESLYGFALQQMATESYLEGVNLLEQGKVEGRLKLGANREGYKTGSAALNDGYPGLTRMTSRQVTEFLAGFRLIHQWSDNPTPTGSRPSAEGDPDFPQLNSDVLANTGLSATLIQARDANGTPTNEYTLAIRSTEFRDWANGGDGERDKTGADINSIAYTGFALAQLDALEQYHQWLRSNTDSLGNPLLPADAKLNVTGYSLGGHLATVFTEIHRNEMNGGQTVTFNGAGRGAWDASQGDLSDVIAYYRSVLKDPAYAPNPGDQISLLRLAALQVSGSPFSNVSIYNDPRYAWAIEATRKKFGLSWMPLSDEQRTGTSADDLITQVFGFETSHSVNATANSGIHGPALRVGIESQPLLEGAGGVAGAEGDFGNAHSITLLADSLEHGLALEPASAHAARSHADRATCLSQRRQLRRLVCAATLLGASAWAHAQDTPPPGWELVTVEGQAMPVPKAWLDSDEARIAHSLKLPEMVPKPRPYDFKQPLNEKLWFGAYRKAAVRYFDHLCVTEAGQWIVRTVPNVAGFYFARPQGIQPPRPLMAERWGPENPWVERSLVYNASDARSGAGSFVSPPFMHYEYIEQPRRDLPWQQGIATPYIRLFGFTTKNARHVDGHLTTHLVEDTPMQVQGVEQLQSRYGFTWRGIKRPQDREHGIAGGEMLIYDLQTREVLAVRRQFAISLGNRRTGDLAAWEIAATCNQIDSRVLHGLLEQREFVLATIPSTKPSRSGRKQ